MARVAPKPEGPLTEADFQLARRYLLLAELAYATPPAAAASITEHDVLAFVCEKHRDEIASGTLVAPTKATFYSASQTGDTMSDAQIYVLVFADSVVFSIRGTATKKDERLDFKIWRTWFTDVGFGRYVSTSDGGISPRNMKSM